MIELRHFTPSEAARISGVNVALQRDWRRRGLLPKSEGSARFDPFAVASMLCVELLTQRGVGPVVSKPLAGLLGAGVVRAAIEVATEFGGPLKGVGGAVGDMPVTHPDFLELVEAAHAKDKSHWTWQGRAQSIAAMIFAGRDPAEQQVRRAFFWWADGSTEFVDSLVVTLEALESGDAKLAGPVIFLDFSAIAATFLARCEGPFAIVTGER